MLDQSFAHGIVQNVMDGRFDGSVIPNDAVVAATLPQFAYTALFPPNLRRREIFEIADVI
jgi:hypothetical protein